MLEVISATECQLGATRWRYQEDALGFSAGGTVSNMSVSMFAWIAQLADVSLRAVTRIE